MRILITHATLITPRQTLPDHTLVLEGDRILQIAASADAPLPARTDTVIDAAGMYVSPGLIDLHIHGCAGADTMDAAPDTLPAISRFLAAHGVTGFLPTTISASPAALQNAVSAYRLYRGNCRGARPLGLHLEGPYLNPGYTGAQPAAHLRLPDPAEYLPWLADGDVRVITLAPEVDGALDLIREAAQHGVRTAAGHTDASYEQALEAVEAGLRLSVHTFNGMGPLHHRRPGLLGAALSDERVFCELIADGVHIHPAVLRMAVRAKGLIRALLVTDSMRAAGLPDGEYDLGGQPIRVQAGTAVTAAGNLAGSTLTLDQAVRNAMQMCGLPFADAVQMASLTPACALGFEARKGALAPGADADVVLWDAE
ncbi:MAG: N-acetylglucosamine-6-phosphate deacetylase, partial [Anaerolineaceae bacterium]